MIAELEKERTKLKEWYETTRIDERDEEQREVRQTRNKKKVIAPMVFTCVLAHRSIHIVLCMFSSQIHSMFKLDKRSLNARYHSPSRFI